MRGTALALITASLLSLAACGGDDTSPTGGSGSGGTGGSGGGSGSGGTGGKAGTGGTGTAGTGGSGGSGGGGQAGTAPADASTPDVRRDTPGTSDVNIDRPPTIDAPGTDGGTSDTTPPSDGPPMDTGSPPDGGQPDTTPPTDGPRSDAPADARDATGTDGSTAMVLTSSAFAEGAMIPADFTCAGTNVSPPLQWTPGPAGTMSYALVFTDKNNSLIHSIIYDIPSTVTSLPMAVERTANPSTPAGAKQLAAYDGMPGYAGPCPSGQLHTYEFSIRAIDVAALPGVTTSSMRPIVEPIITTHTLARGILTGQSNAKK